jgi:protease YdgD
MKELAWFIVVVSSLVACGGSDSGSNGGACADVVSKDTSLLSEACVACLRASCCDAARACTQADHCDAAAVCGRDKCASECPALAADTGGTGGGSAGSTGSTGGTGAATGGTGAQSTAMTPPAKGTAKKPKMPLDTATPGASEMADDANACTDAALDGLGTCGNDTILLFCSDGALWALDCTAAADAEGLADGTCIENEKLVTCVGRSTEAGPDSCQYAEDGACDDPGVCAADTDTTDCAQDACEYANDGTCDVPAYCAVGTDVNDCARADSCLSANDGQCDEPSACDAGTDSTDCAADSCTYANDGVCDGPEICDAGTDTTDCAAEAPAGDDSCEYANDGTCDLPPDCDEGTDTTDCTP